LYQIVSLLTHEYHQDDIKGWGKFASMPNERVLTGSMVRRH